MHVWHFSDGRAGHDRQVEALLGAMGERVELTIDRLSPAGTLGALSALLRHRFRPDLADPAMVFGAGHDTHASLLAAARIRRARSVVLMRPSLPLAWFDSCIVPRHDRPPERDNVIRTLGPLSPIGPSDERGEVGLILVGGPSRHAPWSDAAVIERIEQLVAADPDRRWHLTTSRRTPESFAASMPDALRDRLAIQEPASQPPGWLDRQLPRCGVAWVTPDSLAMVFDALSSGVPCGVLDLPLKPGSRVARAVDELVAEGQVARFDPDDPAAAPPSRPPLREADEVAETLLKRWAP